MIITFQHDNKELLKVFDNSRINFIKKNNNDKLIENYSKWFNYQEQLAFSIGYKNNCPYLFSTIFRRDWWPEGCYRILNRTWKQEKQFHISKAIDPLFLEMVQDQLKWLIENKNFKTGIISREHNSRNTLLNVKNYLNTYEYKFNLLDTRVKMCDGPDCHCLQDILYTGNNGVFKKWNKLKD